MSPAADLIAAAAIHPTADLIRQEVSLPLSKSEIMTLIGWHNFVKFTPDDGGVDNEGHALYLRLYDAYQRTLEWEKR